MEKETLIQEYFENQEINIRKIVNEYSRYLYIVIQNTSKSMLESDDIEELISDVFLAVWKNRFKLDYNAPIKPYLAGIARNLVKNKLRSLKIYNIQLLEESSELYNDEIETVVESKEKFEIIEKTLEEFGDNSKIFVMFYYQSKKVKEIAEYLGQTEFNINTKLHRMRKKIKNRLEERGYYYGR